MAVPPTDAASSPLVSCLMVTRDRPALARRALQCLSAQTWPRFELVIVDDGAVDYSEMLAPFSNKFPIHYHRLPPEDGRFLGALRNISLERANGEFLVQWDDDEWYHPDRIRFQVEHLLRTDSQAVVLKWTLMHLSSPRYVDHPYRSDVGAGTPGTILHRKTAVRYPNAKRAEDSVFLEQIRSEGPVGVLGPEHSHLFIRCFHGANTWDESHFLRRLRRTPRDALELAWARFVRRDIFAHRAFQLSAAERQAAQRFLAESRELGLLPPRA